jgi:monofunctional biosynthetic peptidoglycan transglycosylase
MFVGAITLLCFLAGGLLLAWFFISLPDVQSLKSCLTTKMYKVRLCETSGDFVTLDKVSPALIGAVIMSEDASFFSHDGLDMNEMKESLIRNLTEGRYARGGSTITQQLVKNVFLSGEKSIFRKLQEIYLATQVEKSFTKNKILTFYLNVVEFGPDLFGVKRASRHYFNKSPSELWPEEGAFLAYLLPNPKKYSESFRKHQLTPFAYQSVRKILRKMLLGKKINESEFTQAISRVDHLFGGSKHELPEGEVVPDENFEDTRALEAEPEPNEFNYDSEDQ